MRLTSIATAAAIGCAALVSAAGAAPFDAADGWIEIAHFDGNINITAAHYQNGLGSMAESNYAAPAADFASWGSGFTVGVVVGSFTDYFRASSPSWNLQDMLSSNQRHAWSASHNGTFVTPTYYASGLGGSGAEWPMALDQRLFLSFWGSDAARPGACCQDVPGAAPGWGLPLTMYLQPLAAVPESSTLALMAAGLALLLGFKRSALAG